MIYVFGSRLYGKVDEVKGLGHVATKFGHFDYFPFVPMGTWLVTSQDGNGWRGVPIPWSFKSMLMGWGRGVALFTLVLGAFMSVVIIGDVVTAPPARPTRAIRNGQVVLVPARSRAPEIAGSIGLFVFSAWVLIGSRWTPGFGKATARRAEKLARLAGLSDDVIDQLLFENCGARPAGGFDVVPGRLGSTAKTLPARSADPARI
jgi:hypothetical protein